MKMRLTKMGLTAIVLTLALLVPMGGCGEKGTPEQVAQACKHQVTLSMWSSWEKRVREQLKMAPKQIEAARPAAKALFDKELQTDKAKAILDRCETVFARLSKSQIECRLNAKSPDEFRACPPQAKKK
jgi:hypothetical protein